MIWKNVQCFRKTQWSILWLYKEQDPCNVKHRTICNRYLNSSLTGYFAWLSTFFTVQLLLRYLIELYQWWESWLLLRLKESASGHKHRASHPSTLLRYLVLRSRVWMLPSSMRRKSVTLEFGSYSCWGGLADRLHSAILSIRAITTRRCNWFVQLSKRVLYPFML